MRDGGVRQGAIVTVESAIIDDLPRMHGVVGPILGVEHAGFETLIRKAYRASDVVRHNKFPAAGVKMQFDVRHFSRDVFDVDVEGEVGRGPDRHVINGGLGMDDVDVTFVVP